MYLNFLIHNSNSNFIVRSHRGSTGINPKPFVFIQDNMEEFDGLIIVLVAEWLALAVEPRKIDISSKYLSSLIAQILLSTLIQSKGQRFLCPEFHKNINLVPEVELKIFKLSQM